MAWKILLAPLTSRVAVKLEMVCYDSWFCHEQIWVHLVAILEPFKSIYPLFIGNNSIKMTLKADYCPLISITR